MRLPSVQGGVLGMVSHALTIAALFFAVDWLYKTTGSFAIEDWGGLRRSAPKFAALLLLVVLGSVALPLTVGFAGEFLILLGLIERHIALAAIAAFCAVLSAWYMLRFYRLAMLGEHENRRSRDIDFAGMVILGVLAAAIFGLGVFPGSVLRLSENAARGIVSFGSYFSL
jgi:NADH-quinone oxidoreductase subunit M